MTPGELRNTQQLQTRTLADDIYGINELINRESGKPVREPHQDHGHMIGLLPLPSSSSSRWPREINGTLDPIHLDARQAADISDIP